MRPEIGVTLRLLLNADNTIPKGGRIQRALDVLNSEDGDLPEIVSVAKMAEKLHKSTATVYNLIESGLLARVVGKGGRTLGIARDSAVFFLNGEFKKKMTPQTEIAFREIVAVDWTLNLPRQQFYAWYRKRQADRVNRAIAILKGEKEEPEQWSMDWSPLKKFMHMKEEDVCQLVVDGKIRFVMQGDKTLGLWVNDIREQLVPGYHKLPERYCRLL